MERTTKKTRTDYLLEKVAPLSVVFILLLPFILSLFSPQLAIAFLIVINVYFFYKSGAIAIQFAIALRRFQTVEQINWQRIIEGFENIPERLTQLYKTRDEINKYKWNDFLNDKSLIYNRLQKENKLLSVNSTLPTLLQRIVFWFEKSKTLNFLNQEIALLEDYKYKQFIKPNELQHIIIVPHVKEPEEILEETIERLKNQTFNTKQLNIVLAAEAADPNGVTVSEKIKSKYEKYFNNIWITNHVLQPQDVVGKSANMDWAGRKVYAEVKKLGWDLKKTTVTSCDADSKFDPNHFSLLTYKYIITEDPEYKFYTGAMIFYNNIWRLPFYARVKNSYHSIFNAANLVRTDKLIPFSTYTTSFWTIEQIDFWDPWITPEDYHVFFKAVFTLDRKVWTVPLFIKILSDAAEGEGHWDTIKNNYKQSRRWAWGVSDGGWMLKNLVSKSLSFPSIYKTIHVIFDHTIGVSVAFLILLGGSIPGFVNPDFNTQISGALFPIVSSNVIQFSIIFLIIIVLLDFSIRPKPDKSRWYSPILSILEWFVQPFASFFLTTLPGLEAQGRIIFGKYLEYYVTQKKATNTSDKTSSDIK